MRTNGLLYIQRTSVSKEAETTTFDEDGNPIENNTKWCGPLPCSIMTITDNRMGIYEDGHYRACSFCILLDSMEFPCRKADMVKLVRQGEDLGEFAVQSIELIESVGRVKMIV